MKTIIYSIKDFEQSYLLQANKMNHDVILTGEPLNDSTAHLAQGCLAVALFAGDDASAAVIEKLHIAGVRHIAVRAVGHDNVDIKRAKKLGIKVANVPEYSPYAVAEHSVALMLALNRKLNLAYSQVHRQDFTVAKLVGFDLHGKTVGIIGTGRIGSAAVRILNGFGCTLLAYDIVEKKELTEKYKLRYVDLTTLCRTSDIITLYTPLTLATKYLINRETIAEMKQGVMIINTARGAVMNTQHIIEALESGKIGYLGTDVYENEKGVFFYDHSQSEIKDEMLKKLIAFPNVIVTPHQAFATQEALSNIAATTFYNLNCWAQGRETENELTGEAISNGFSTAHGGK